MKVENLNIMLCNIYLMSLFLILAFIIISFGLYKLITDELNNNKCECEVIDNG